MTTAAAVLDDLSAESTFRTVNGVELHVAAAGDPDDPLVVLLHGFPEYWYGWHNQIPPLVDAGYRVLVPDQRGYNRSQKPESVGSYRLPELSRDVRELIRSEGRESAHVIGHDWGAAVAWDLALRHPSTVDRLAILNVPHPSAFLEALRSTPEQLLRSWYVLFFQLPRVPEWFLRRNGYGGLERALRDSSADGTFSDEDIALYRRSWEHDGALTGMLNWYRAAVRYRDRPPRERVDQPTLIVWGDGDAALVPELAPRSVQYCADGRLERFPGRTHWLHHEAPTEVAELLLDHLEGGQNGVS